MKSARTTQAVLELPFQIDSISEAPAPEGAHGIWHRYVISQGVNIITGLRAGTRDEVAVLVADIVVRLNERRLGTHRPKPKA
jgi:hypothetical protein